MSEILSDEAGLTSDIELKVIRNEIMSYNYPWKGTDVATQNIYCGPACAERFAGESWGK